MAITTFDQYLAAPKQNIQFKKTTGITVTANAPFSLFTVAGYPTAGAVAVGDTTTGIVPVAGTTGYPAINAFVGANVGYITRASATGNASTRHVIYDCLFAFGAVPATATTNVTTPPSFVSRLPGGYYDGLQIWVEWATAGAGAQSVSISYTNEFGVAARTTGTVATAITAGAVGSMARIPLQNGDNGVQSIQSITLSVATAGTLNVYIMRPLLTISNMYGVGECLSLDGTGMPIVYATSALRFVTMSMGGTTTGVPIVNLEIANG